MVIGSYSVAYGVLSDITTVADRGSYIGSLIVLCVLHLLSLLYRLLLTDFISSTNAAPSFGPVIAGVLAEKMNWRWIFWFLVVLTGTYALILLLLLPETQRKVVGNGSIPTKRIHGSLFDLLTRDRKTESKDGEAQLSEHRHKHHFPNPFRCLPMLLSRGNLSVILVGSITYTVKITLQTSLASQCIEIYGLDYLQAGLIYLPSGLGGAVASYSTGAS